MCVIGPLMHSRDLPVVSVSVRNNGAPSVFGILEAELAWRAAVFVPGRCSVPWRRIRVCKQCEEISPGCRIRRPSCGGKKSRGKVPTPFFRVQTHVSEALCTMNGLSKATKNGRHLLTTASMSASCCATDALEDTCPFTSIHMSINMSIYMRAGCSAIECVGTTHRRENPREILISGRKPAADHLDIEQTVPREAAAARSPV